jgi:hypothetical protein
MKIYRMCRPSRYPIFLVLATLLLFSCSGSKSNDPGDDPGPIRDTPDALFQAYASCYEEKDLEGCDECLHEDFLFVFTPEVADSLSLPPEEPWWGKTEDLKSTEEMFGDPQVLEISFSYEFSETWYTCTEVRDDTTYSGLCCRLDPVLAVVTVVTSADDPLLIYRVDSSWLDITVVPDPYTEGLWCILRLEETKKQWLQPPFAPANTATERSTWSGIKSMWAKQ